MSRFVEHATARIHYLDSGDEPEAGPPVLFVPGVTDIALDYLGVLAQFGRRTIVVDLRGRGASSAPDHGYASADHVEDIDAVLAHAGVDRVHLVTFSRGTAYGLEYASRHPDRILTVAIGDYPAREIRPPEGWSEPFIAGRWRGTPVRERIAEHALVEIAREAKERDYWDLLARLGRPVLVIRAGVAGSRGFEFVDPDARRRYAEAVPDVEIVTFADSRHDLFEPDAKAFPRLVADFLTRRHPG
jgi:non-heme chloroperoxidase